MVPCGPVGLPLGPIWAPLVHFLAPFGHLWGTFLAPVASFGHRWGSLEPYDAQLAPFRAHFGPKLSQIVLNCPSVLSWGFNLGSILVKFGFLLM